MARRLSAIRGTRERGAEVASFNVLKNILPYLTGTAPKPALPVGLSYEFVTSPTGGAFTGNIVQEAPRTDPGIFEDPAFKQFVGLIPAIIGAIPSGGSSLVGVLPTLKAAFQQDQPLPKPVVVGRIPTMSFADGTSDGFDLSSVFGGINQALQGGLGQSLLGLGTQLGSAYISSSFGPVYSGIPGTSGPVAQPVMSSVPAIARGAMTVGRTLFNRFPNLATAIQRLRNAGANVTRSRLWSLMKRFGPDFLISGGILTAAAASELAMAGPGRRRMNPGNIKALRKAHRRMKSFHHVCKTNDMLLGGSHRRKASSSGRFATSITQVK